MAGHRWGKNGGGWQIAIGRSKVPHIERRWNSRLGIISPSESIASCRTRTDQACVMHPCVPAACPVALVAVAETQSFSVAADALSVSQPTVSIHLAALEAACG